MSNPTIQKKHFSFRDIPRSAYINALFPKLQQKKAQNITALILTVIMLSFFGLFAISPTLSTITDLQKQISDGEFVNQKLQEKITNLSSLQNQYTQLQHDLPYIYHAVPTSPQLSDFVGKIQALSITHHAFIPSIQTFPLDIGPSSHAKYTSFSFSFEAQGTYQDVVAFIASLSQFDRSITYDSITITQGSGINAGVFLTDVRGETFFKAE